jgi:acyl-CoA synthetase (AMP-forming)/AMP-acid ligase II
MLGLMQDHPLLLSSVLDHAERTYPDVEVISHNASGERRSTYAETATRARRLASSLMCLGIGYGGMVGSLAWNTHRLLELFYAAPGIGAVLHTANPRLSVEQIAYCINQAGYRHLFVDPESLDLAEQIAPLLSTVTEFVILADAADMPPTRLAGTICYEDLIEAGDADFAWPVFDERTASTLCFTSGTTGNPKGVLYSHRGTLLSALATSGGNGWAVSQFDSILAIAPFFHCNGWAMPFFAPMVGAKLVLPGRAMDNPHLHRLIVEEAITASAAVPTILLGLIEHCRATGQTLGRLDRVICGGSPPPPALVAALRSEFGVRLIHAWGMTETTHGASFSPTPADATVEQVVAAAHHQGWEVYGNALRVVGEDGKEPPPDGTSPGHLQARGHWVAARYFRDAAAPPTNADGWMETGDVAIFSPDRSFRITDRAKDVIKSGGEWISSIEIEHALIGLPGLRDAAVIGVAHQRWMERPLLLVVPSDDGTLTEDEVRRHLSASIPKWWLPDEILFVDVLPRTPTGKLRKDVLRREYRDRFQPPGESG